MNQIHYVGYDGIHPNNFKYDIPNGFDSFLLVVTKTPVLFRIQTKVEEYPAHTAILYPPKHDIWYAACKDSYQNHWLRFVSDESFVTQFPKQAVPFLISDPEYCRSLFKLLTWETSQLISSARLYQNAGMLTQNRDAHFEHQNMDKHCRNITISQLIRILFDKLYNDAQCINVSKYDQLLLSLRRQIAANPEIPWDITTMANSLCISNGYLQRLYKQKFNISCMDDVIHFRLHKARDLLLYTTESISTIAEQCGYNNTEHFCNQFQKNIGTTPGKFRRNSKQHTEVPRL